MLTDRQRRILEIAREPVDVDELAGRLGLRREDLMRDIEELSARGLVRVRREEVKEVQVTEEGARYLRLGLPEERLARVLESGLRAGVRELAARLREAGVEMDEAEARVGLQYLIKSGAAAVVDGRVELRDRARLREVLERAERVRRFLSRPDPSDELVRELGRRRLVRVRVRKRLVIETTPEARRMLESGMIVSARVITALTPEVIASGSWRGAVFKEYDLSVSPPVVYPGRKHPYLEFLDMVREILVSMGFEEMKGPHVELELWNFDALFQAQDHPAREIHDTYFLKHPRVGEFGDRALMERIARTHEDGWVTGSRGWGYKWDPSRALRLVLRTQTTAVSMRTIYERGEGEYMCFSLDRVFRPENLDAKHSMEFYQLEGIIVGRRVTFRHLIGFFKEMARRLGLGEVKVKPAYFPFTEPSVEGFIRHPRLGWIEVFPGGMFRPEVLYPLGVRNANVAAWGIGIDRIAMSVLGIDDIRLLFSQDLDFLRRARKPSLVGALDAGGGGKH